MYQNHNKYNWKIKLFNKVMLEQIFTVASNIINTGKIPTLDQVRCYIGTGSKTTIHKYFKQWKYECLKKGSAVLNKIQQIDQEQLNYKELVEEKSTFKKMLNKQKEQNEYYAQELINAEKANIALKEENHQLQNANQGLQLKLTAAESTNHALDQVTKKIQNELNLNTNETIKKMQQTIDNLRTELKTLNEISLIAVRETSSKGHETLMQEKVTSINLQAKIDLLTKELLENKKQLELANSNAHLHAQSLKRQIEQQQKILKNYLNSAQLQELAQGMEINYTLLEIGCGK